MRFPDDQVLSAIEAAFKQDRYRQAWSLAQGLADVRAWRGARQRVVAGRLAATWEPPAWPGCSTCWPGASTPEMRPP